MVSVDSVTALVPVLKIMNAGMMCASLGSMGSRVLYWSLKLTGGPHTVPVQTFGAAQSAATLHVVRQAVGPHAYGGQFVMVPVWQVPVPLHVRAVVATFMLQTGPTHWVPAT